MRYGGAYSSAPPPFSGGAAVYNRSMPKVPRPGLQTSRGISSRTARRSTTRVVSPAPSTSYKGGVRAKLTLGTGANAVQYVANVTGAAQNSIRVRYVVAGNNTPLTVSVSGLDITVNVATNGGGTATSKGQDVADAVNKSKAAGDLVRAHVTGPGNAAVSAVAFTNLAGGAS